MIQMPYRPPGPRYKAEGYKRYYLIISFGRLGGIQEGTCYHGKWNIDKAPKASQKVQAPTERFISPNLDGLQTRLLCPSIQTLRKKKKTEENFK